MARNANNKGLSAAAKAKKDEFYTQLSDIEKELKSYKKHFKDKGYRDGSFVLIRGGDPQNTAEAIRSCKPENSMAFRLDKDTFLLASHNPGERALKAYEQLLKTEYDAAGGGKSLDISVVVQSKEENFEEFVKRAGL